MRCITSLPPKACGFSKAALCTLFPVSRSTKSEHYRRGAEIDRKPEHVSPVAVHHLAVVEHLVAPPRDEGIERRRRAGRIRMGAHQDARAAAERRKRHVDVVALDHRPGRRGGRERAGSSRPRCAPRAPHRPRSPRPRIRGSGRCAGRRSALRRRARRRSRRASCRWQAAPSCRRGKPCPVPSAVARLPGARRRPA